jgi:hypothetical protein
MDEEEDEDIDESSEAEEDLDPEHLLGTSQQTDDDDDPEDNQEEDENNEGDIEPKEQAQSSENSVAASSSELFFQAITNDIVDAPPGTRTKQRQPSILAHLEAMNNDFLPSASTSQRPEDLRWGSNTATRIKQKRVLSSNTLATLNASSAAGRKGDSPKRLRSTDNDPTMSFDLPDFSLGASALDQSAQEHFRNSEDVMSSDDDEELDRRLSEELGEASRPAALDENEEFSSQDNSPIPLLTPPQSPLTIDVGEGGAQMFMCEWPSNLVVDTSMLAVLSSDIRPLSPGSLTKFEAAEDERISGHLKATSGTSQSTSLTPMLRSINVAVE